jgi:hypothetical protein
MPKPTLIRFISKPVLAVAASVALLAGCQTTSMQEGSSQSTAQAEFEQLVYLQDFPIPKGAKWDSQKTLILGSGKGWTGRLAFSAPMGETEAFQFFQEQMTKLGWQPVSLVRAKTSILAFTRTDRAALVEVTGQMMGGIVVSITVTPR